jgi:hypothetical protein
MEITGQQVEGWSEALPLTTSYHDRITHVAKEAAAYASEQWAKVLTAFIDKIGGDGPSLWNWQGQTPTPEKVVNYLEKHVKYLEELSESKWIAMILKFLQDHGSEVEGKWGEVDAEWAKSALEELLEVREQVAAENEMFDSNVRVRTIQDAAVENLPLKEAAHRAIKLLKNTEERLQMERQGSRKEEMFLYFCKSTVNAMVVASNEEDALIKFEENYSEIVDSVAKEVPKAVVNEVIDRVHCMLPGNMWEGYVPHGDYYGPQEECSYYTVEAHEKRLAEKKEKEECMAALLEGLSEGDIETLKDLLLSEREKEILEYN